jgi:hypothetical protein
MEEALAKIYEKEESTLASVAHRRISDHEALCEERYKAIERRLGMLFRSHWVGVGFIAALITFLNYPHLANVVAPNNSPAVAAQLKE